MNMEDDIERWTAKRKSARVRDIIQGKATIIEASRQYDLSASEVDQWIDDDKQGMENALRAKKLQSLLGEAGPGDRLPYPRVARLAYVAQRQGLHRRQRLGTRPDRPFRNTGTRACAVPEQVLLGQYINTGGLMLWPRRRFSYEARQEGSALSRKSAGHRSSELERRFLTTRLRR